MKVIIVILATLAMVSVSTVQAEQANVLFILDGSGSMWAQVEGKAKITVAKEVMIKLVKELPDNVNTGLQVYGHRSKGDCDDIEMLVPLGSTDRQLLIGQVESIMPKGKTPITKSFMEAAEKLRATEEKTTVVLVSDGKETCEGDPCDLVAELKKQGIKIEVHVVGFDVSTEEGEQLKCIAEAGGGKYFSANNADQLHKALGEVKEHVVAEKPKKPVAIKKKKIIKIAKTGTISVPNLSARELYVCKQQDNDCGWNSEGFVGSIKPKKTSLELSAGTYKIQFRNIYVDNIEVKSGQTTELMVGSISVPNLSSRDLQVCDQQDNDCGWNSDKHVGQISPKKTSLEVPAGTYKLQFRNIYVDNIEVKSGQTTELRVGSISVPNLTARDLEVCEQQDNDCGWDSDRHVGNIEPDQTSLEVPAGTYKLQFRNIYVDNIEVKSGQTTEFMVGSISVPNLSSDDLEVCEQQDNECGWDSPKHVGNITPKKQSLEVPAGTYRIKNGYNFIEGIEVGPNEEIVLDM